MSEESSTPTVEVSVKTVGEDGATEAVKVPGAEDAEVKVKSPAKAENGGDEAVEPTPLERKIVRQIEYYFGDMSLPNDKFLQEQIKQDEGWVPMETMIKFNRLKQMSEDPAVISAALKKIKSDLLELSEDGQKVRRSLSVPLPENTAERRKDINTKTCYAKGFPLDISLDELMEYFKEHGTVESIFMRKDQKREFKGSVFAVFTDKAEMDKFLAAKEIKYKDTNLLRYSREDYFKMKAEEKKVTKEQDDKKKQEDQKKRAEVEQVKFEESMTKGAVLHLKGFVDGTNMEDIKEHFSKFGDVAWVDFARGDKEAYVRFNETDIASTALEQAKADNDGKLTIKDAEIESRVLEGEEEVKYWKQAFADRAARRDKKRTSRKRFSGNRYGKKVWGRKSRDGQDAGSDSGGEADEGEPPVKKVKAE